MPLKGNATFNQISVKVNDIEYDMYPSLFRMFLILKHLLISKVC